MFWGTPDYSDDFNAMVLNEYPALSLFKLRGGTKIDLV